MLKSFEFGSPFPMQEALKAADDRILYVGAGWHFPDNISQHDIQVGLNIDPRQHDALSEKSGPNKFAVLCDLRKLDENDPTAAARQQSYLRKLFDNIGFTSLRFINVFGEYNIPQHFFSDKRINPTGRDYLGASTDAHKLLSLRATTNFLETNGELIIMEFVTPSMGMAPTLLANPQILGDFGYVDIDATLFAGESIHDDSPPFQITARKC